MTALGTDPVRSAEPRVQPFGGRWRRLGAVEMLAVVLIVAIAARQWLLGLVDSPLALTLMTVFVSIMVQAVPFIILGTLLSAASAAFVPARFFDRALPRRAAAAVPVAGVVGVALPTSECGSVPAAAGLVSRGVWPAAAFAYLLASPAISPVVLVSTAVAFPGQPSMVAARFVASLAVAAIMGWLWLRFGRPVWLRPTRVPEPRTGRGWPSFWASCRRDVVQASGVLVVGALAAATLTVAVPPRWLAAIAENPVFSVIALALLAVLLSICSEADAFVVASLSQFSLTARLTFLVVGPMVDLKLFANQTGYFGPRFAMRFAPTTLVTAIVVSVLVGWVIL